MIPSQVESGFSRNEPFRLVAGIDVTEVVEETVLPLLDHLDDLDHLDHLFSSPQHHVNRDHHRKQGNRDPAA